jgi:hypothetical protein
METMSAEAKALHAELAGDTEEVDRILGTFLRGELIELARACGYLANRALEIRAELPTPRSSA